MCHSLGADRDRRAAELRATRIREQIMGMLDRCANGSAEAAARMCRLLWHALVQRTGGSVRIGRGDALGEPVEPLAPHTPYAAGAGLQALEFEAHPFSRAKVHELD